MSHTCCSCSHLKLFPPIWIKVGHTGILLQKLWKWIVFFHQLSKNANDLLLPTHVCTLIFVLKVLLEVAHLLYFINTRRERECRFRENKQFLIVDIAWMLNTCFKYGITVLCCFSSVLEVDVCLCSWVMYTVSGPSQRPESFLWGEKLTCFSLWPPEYRAEKNLQ